MGRAESAKSVVSQVDAARAFAIARGWAVRDEHVYIDDGISGAEFAKRGGLQALLDATLHRKAPFAVVVVAERKALGRESLSTRIEDC